MPILEVHLVEGMHTPAQHAEMLTAMSLRCAELLDASLDQVRAYATLHRPEHWATAGSPVSGRSAPYFTATLLEGRSTEQRHRLLGGLTDIIVDVLGADRRMVQGRIISVRPEDWAIGGVPATARRGEPRARTVTGT
ncbi:MAG TPA: tautomerase family protein [Pseudonocardia sp.]|jgi:4-oxalocrotonate tautomerase family enzyme